MIRRVIPVILMILSASAVFGQAGLLRDYVGLLNIHYHSDVVEYMGKFKDAFEKKGYSDAAKAIDYYLKGLSGSGFAYVAEDGTCYILTNNHVVKQSESLSITFEKQDGAKTTYDRLKVLKVDEEKDLAILYFDTGVKPFAQGLSFIDRPIDEGEAVAAAGFPGIGNTAVWNFTPGAISNVAARLPKTSLSDETIGPYIQHTAPVNPGNSGGPLLEAVPGVPTGYAVIGINTLSATMKEGMHYAIPSDQVKAFIEAALSTEPVNERELIAKKVDDFIKGLQVNKAVYPHIAGFLTGACTASNAEYAISELLDKASRTVLMDIDDTFSYNPVDGMNAAVAWLIENSMRTKSGALKIGLTSIEPNDKGGFIVNFDVNGSAVRSEWVKEYGVYRLDTYGDLVTGDKTLLAEKEKKQKLKTDYSMAISAGYAQIFEGSIPAFNTNLKFGHPVTYGIDFFYGKGGYYQLGMTTGFYIPIRLGTFGLMPFGDVGISYVSSDASKAGAGNTDFGFTFGFSAQAGLMFTFAQVPGLFGQAFYRQNFYLDDTYFKNGGCIVFGLGYGF